MTESKNETPVAVWYFIGATFAGALPNLLFPGLHAWVRVLFILVALVLIVTGFVQLRRETGWGTKPKSDEPPSGTSPDA
ncbi:hypothetical protein KZX37_09210 [Microbacterium sp. EYE_5]|uniref:hypothetical protein n=1 Tax=unclassified Microbacterium TaxID=2609290 RepID=UPI002006836C|nr:MULTISPECIES: hypothetical protein [unclassified Microbacterium]MCK6081306.1 hypothetical protein [Microbacterium sp. EYE_382]MCK6086576.1 hypothetical protein [Microbacterium sp. EYE_384]MCK6123926.1 hypothetical protein [Microbacterium sp. EYE_80]MCK6126835.1 hypothetical protein [Microbacterium sp. EYE_79]MCK6142261.1 hypothetical protein [Microbacterium sp. EYE_39]